MSKTEGSRIRENPALVPAYCNRFVALGWDGLAVTLTLGTSTKLPQRMGDKIAAAEQVVDPKLAAAMPIEVAAEIHAKLGQFLTAISNNQSGGSA
jgi:hypothetical protein